LRQSSKSRSAAREVAQRLTRGNSHRHFQCPSVRLSADGSRSMKETLRNRLARVAISIGRPMQCSDSIRRHRIDCVRCVFQYVFVVQQQRTQRLRLRARGSLSCHSKMREESFDFSAAHIQRTTFVVKQDAPPKSNGRWRAQCCSRYVLCAASAAIDPGAEADG